MANKVKNLVIVESPAKAKTIEKYLGKDYIVKSSVGHIRDLAKKGLGVNIEENFSPTYEISEDKKQVVSELKKLAKQAEVVWLATDEDREGEAISWHLLEALGVKEDKTRRVVYNQITEAAIKAAIDNPKTIDYDLVNAQQARRILDRLVGFELSPVLWKKVKPKLSAGRVQSVTVRLIVEREREIHAFNAESFFKLRAHFDIEGDTILKAELPKNFKTEQEALDFLESCKGANYNIKSIVKKPSKRSPAAPFTTSTLQQEASRKLGYSVSQTMSVAQKLYEAGLITYMRTDSTNLAPEATKAIEDEITRSYGKEYSKSRSYKSGSKGAQEAHEAIRPTDFTKHSVDADGQRLYELIWKRTVASQMAEAQLEKSTVNIGISTNDIELKAKGEMLVFDGFLKVYMEGTDDENVDHKDRNGVLPPLKEGQDLVLTDMMATERFTHHPARYTEASLVKKLEELGIGRPSTYAPTISTVIKRGYVVKEDREGVERNYRVISFENNEIKAADATEMAGTERKKLFPTDIGSVVNDFLVENFSKILDYNFTAQVEKEFDEIASGNMEWQKMLSNFYTPFHENIEYTTENADRASGERELGLEPGTGKRIIVRIGRFGPMAQIGESPKEGDEDAEKPRFAGLRKGQSLEDITLEEALDLFKLPRDLGLYEDKKVVIGVGRFGPYVRHDSKFTSIPKEIDPLEIEFDKAVELIEAKRQADREKFINSFDTEDGLIEVLKGRWGPYIKFNKKNFKIPKDVEAADLSLEECQKLIKDGPKTKKKKVVKKTAAKKTTAKKTTKAKK